MTITLHSPELDSKSLPLLGSNIRQTWLAVGLTVGAGLALPIVFLLGLGGGLMRVAYPAYALVVRI